MKFLYKIVDYYSTFLDWIVFKFFNPYKVNPGGYCPVQAEGRLENGNFYYFRARGKGWSLKVGTQGDMMIFDTEIFHYEDKNYKPWPECGWLSRRECIRLATKALNEYHKNEN